jgi:hypothetical protein
MVRLAPYGQQPNRAKTAMQLDAERIITNQIPTGVRQNPAGKSGKDHLSGPGARMRTSGLLTPTRANEKQHAKAQPGNVRFSQGVVTSATGAAVEHLAKKRPATAVVQRHADMYLKPVHSVAGVTAAAKGCVPRAAEEDNKKPAGKAIRDPFRGRSLQNTCLQNRTGSLNPLHRSRSLENLRRACDEACKPRDHHSVSATFLASDCGRVRTNDERYATAPKPQKRVFGASYTGEVVPPWMKN